MNATNSEHKVAPASAEARATKAERLTFLNQWAMENPLKTIEEARQAVRERFGLSLGTQALSNAMRLARDAWEAQRRAATEGRPALPPRPQPAGGSEGGHEHVSWIANAMRQAGLRLVELLEDGRVRVEFYSA